MSDRRLIKDSENAGIMRYQLLHKMTGTEDIFVSEDAIPHTQNYQHEYISWFALLERAVVPRIKL